MSRGGLPALAELVIADDAAIWQPLGFAVQPDGTLDVGDVTLRLAGADAGEGLLSWTLRSQEALPSLVDGIPTSTASVPPPEAERVSGTDRCAAAHPNGVTGLDHVVVTTPDVDRTLETLRATGMEVRRLRDTGTEDRPMRQGFLWAGDVLVEVAGPATPEGDGPARLWGFVFVTASLEALADHAGDAIGSARPAVQAGRHIATLRREAGSSVPIAFMTPHLRRQEPVS